MIQLDEPALHLLTKQSGKPNPTVVIPTAGNKVYPRKNALSPDFVRTDRHAKLPPRDSRDCAQAEAARVLKTCFFQSSIGPVRYSPKFSRACSQSGMLPHCSVFAVFGKVL